MSRIDGNVAFVTGAAGGIRSEMALLFARSGARLALNDRDESGLLALTRTAAIECAERGFPIRVNLVAPSFTKTPMTEFMIGLLPAEEQIGTYDKLAARHPLERFASTADIANAALFLASKDASYMTGAELVVDGGYSAL